MTCTFMTSTSTLPPQDLRKCKCSRLTCWHCAQWSVCSWNLPFLLFKATLPVRDLLPLGKAPVWYTQWISRVTEDKRSTLCRSDPNTTEQGGTEDEYSSSMANSNTSSFSLLLPKEYIPKCAPYLSSSWRQEDRKGTYCWESLIVRAVSQRYLYHIIWAFLLSRWKETTYNLKEWTHNSLHVSYLKENLYCKGMPNCKIKLRNIFGSDTNM